MNFPPRPCVVFSAVFAALVGVVPFSGRAASTHLVDSIAALQTKIYDAAAGDIITLKDGVYTTSTAITVNRRATTEEPITIAAETVGGVEITGTNGFHLVAPAAHIVISGFKFTHASGKNSIAAGTSGVRFTRNTFQCLGDGPYLAISGDDAQIDYNEFHDKKTAGNMIAVSGGGGQIAQRLWIHHNYFHDVTMIGATGGEMIRFGLAALSLSNGAGLVEHNLFARCRGENEMISNRASGITYRYNTFIDGPNSQFTLRHGNDCIVYGNIFRNTQGLRLYGDRHQVFSNYFEGNYIGVSLGNGSAEVADGAPLLSHDRPDNCVIAFNTLVDNRTHYQMSRRAPDSLGATNTTFANNILQGTGVAARIEGPNADATWSGNMLWINGGAGDMPSEGYTKQDPQLLKGDDGIKHLQTGSPAIETAVGDFPLVTVDFEGQPRPEKKTKGADELSSVPALSRLLTLNDVGPHSKDFGPAPSPSPTPTPSPLPAPSPTPEPAAPSIPVPPASASPTPPASPTPEPEVKAPVPAEPPGE